MIRLSAIALTWTGPPGSAAVVDHSVPCAVGSHLRASVGQA